MVQKRNVFRVFGDRSDSRTFLMFSTFLLNFINLLRRYVQKHQNIMKLVKKISCFWRFLSRDQKNFKEKISKQIVRAEFQRTSKNCESSTPYLVRKSRKITVERCSNQNTPMHSILCFYVQSKLFDLFSPKKNKSIYFGYFLKVKIPVKTKKQRGPIQKVMGCFSCLSGKKMPQAIYCNFGTHCFFSASDS